MVGIGYTNLSNCRYGEFLGHQSPELTRCRPGETKIFSKAGLLGEEQDILGLA